MTELSELVPIIHEKTVNRKINWQMNGETSVWYRIGENLLVIDSGIDFDDDPYLDIDIRNSDGKIVESTRYFRSLGLPEYHMLAEILAKAKRLALNIDVIVDDIKGRLLKL